MSAVVDAFPGVSSPTVCPAQVGPLARRVALAFMEAAGTVDGFCVDAATLLCHLLRSQGHDARVVCGFYGEFEHAWVEADGWVLDPTREQFTGGPARIVLHPQDAAAFYQESGWEWSAPERPDADDASLCFRLTLGGHDDPGTFCGELAMLLADTGCTLH